MRPCDDRAHRIFLRRRVPRIGQCLLQPQRDAALLCLDFEHDHLYVVSILHDFRRVLRVLRPAHFAHVHEAFDARLDLHERAVVRDAHHFSVHARSRRETLRHRGPRIGKQLLPAERNPLLLLVELQNLYLNFVAGLDDRGRMRHAAPHEIAYVKKPVHSAEVYENSIVRHILDASRHDRAFRERIGQSVALVLLLFFEDRAPADDHIAALAVQLQDANFDLAVLPRFQIVHGPQLDLRSRQKRADADVNHQPALDSFRRSSRYVCMLAVGFFDSLPDAAAVRAHIR